MTWEMLATSAATFIGLVLVLTVLTVLVVSIGEAKVVRPPDHMDNLRWLAEVEAYVERERLKRRARMRRRRLRRPLGWRAPRRGPA